MPLCGKNTDSNMGATVTMSWDLTPCFVVTNWLIVLFVFCRSEMFLFSDWNCPILQKEEVTNESTEQVPNQSLKAQ
jgi:hypothetical protein